MTDVMADSGDFYKQFGGRKFLMAFGWMAITFIGIFVTDKISFPQWVEWAKYAFGFFVLGNGIEHGANAVRSRRQA